MTGTNTAASAMNVCEKQMEIQMAELVRQTLATFPVENITAIINATLKRVGNVECLQILTSTAKQVALERVTKEMSDKVSSMVDVWITNQLNSEAGGKKSLREALKATASPKSVTFVTQELRVIGPEILKGLITEHGNSQVEEYVKSHIPVIAATLMTNIVKRFSEDHVQAVGLQGLKDAVVVQAPEAVTRLLASSAPQAVQDGLRKQVEIQAPDVVDATLKIVGRDVVSESVRDEAHRQVPNAVSSEISKLKGVIESAVAQEAKDQVIPVVKSGLSTTVQMLVPGIVTDESKKQAPNAVTSSIEGNVDGIVGTELRKVSHEMAPSHVEASLGKQTGDVVKENLNNITPALAQTEAEAEVKTQASGIVTKALHAVVPDLATSAAKQAASEQAGPVVMQELLDSKDKTSLIVADAVNAEAVSRAPGVVSEMITTTDVKGIAEKALTEQAQGQAPDAVQVQFQRILPSIVREKGDSEVSSKISVAVVNAVKEISPLIEKSVAETVKEDVPAIVRGHGHEMAEEMLKVSLPAKINERSAELVHLVSEAYSTDEILRDYRASLKVMMDSEVDAQREIVQADRVKMNNSWWNKLFGVITAYKLKNLFSGGSQSHGVKTNTFSPASFGGRGQTTSMSFPLKMIAVALLLFLLGLFFLRPGSAPIANSVAGQPASESVTAVEEIRPQSHVSAESSVTVKSDGAGQEVNVSGSVVVRETPVLVTIAVASNMARSADPCAKCEPILDPNFLDKY